MHFWKKNDQVRKQKTPLKSFAEFPSTKDGVCFSSADMPSSPRAGLLYRLPVIGAGLPSEGGEQRVGTQSESTTSMNMIKPAVVTYKGRDLQDFLAFIVIDKVLFVDSFLLFGA